MDADRFQQIARTVADPSRLAALRLIAERGEVTCSCLKDHLGLTAATVSHHVKELTASGLVSARKEAKFHYLKLVPGVWQEWLRALEREIPATPAAPASSLRRRSK